MKNYLLLIFVFLFCTYAKAQNITKIEYFIDSDPGFGSGTDVPISESSIVTANFDIVLPNTVTDGFHFLSVRARDSDNKWSLVSTRPFYKEEIVGESIPNITAMEYFIDTDPGFGMATSISVSGGSSETQNFTIALLNTVPNGFHYLSIRAKDSNNNWSIVATRPFYKENINVNAIPNIIAMEYFIDGDPGYGAGTQVSITPNTIKEPSIYADLNSLSDGLHRISIRAKDENNKWSIVGIKEFTVSNTFTKITALPTTWCRNTTLSIPFTAIGTFNVGNVFTAQLSNSVGSFSSPTSLGTFTGISSGTISAIVPNSIAVYSGYKVRIVASNPSTAVFTEETLEIVANCDVQLVTGHVEILADAVFCTGGTITVPFSTYGSFQVNNTFGLQLSDANGNNFASIPGIVANNKITAIIPDGLTPGDSYRVRVISSSPSIFGNEAVQSLRIRNSDLETILSSQSGNWNDPDVWSCSRLPASQRTVSIVIGQNITAPTNGTSSVKNLLLAGNLNFDTNPSPNSSFTIARVMATQASGTLSISTYFEISATASITAKIYSSTDYDKIIVGGFADLNGTLNVIFDPSYTPIAGNSFTILSYVGRESAFATINLPTLSGGMTWETIYSDTGITFTIKPAVALPIVLISLTARAEKEGNILNWQTTNETNFSHFEIEKSYNAQKFVKIGELKGEKSEYYEFVDEDQQATNHKLIYYRLRLVDLDEKFSYSKIVSVNFEGNANFVTVENPAHNGAFKVFTNLKNAKISLLDGLGKKMESTAYPTTESEYLVKTKNLPIGLYFLMVEADGSLITRKVLIE